MTIPLSNAHEIYAQLVDALHPYATKMKLVGSAGRLEDPVGDVDVALKMKEPAGPLIDEIQRNFPAISTIKKAGPRYIQLENFRNHSTQIDIYLCHAPAQWGLIVAYRLNPPAFVQWIKRQLDSKGFQRGGATLTDAAGFEVPVPDEETLFDLLGLPYVPPHERRELMKAHGIT